jgi:hypothetical protein
VRSNADALLARARAVAEGQHRPPPPPPAPTRPAERTPMQTASAPVVEKVRVPMTCGASGGAFIAIAERRGSDLLLLGSEEPQTGRNTGGGTPPEKLSGAYSIGWSGWSCPLCRSSATGWLCGCPQGSLQCGGSRGSRRYCACGRLEDRHLVQAEAGVEVRGQSLGATTGAGPARGGSNLPTLRKGR